MTNDLAKQSTTIMPAPVEGVNMTRLSMNNIKSVAQVMAQSGMFPDIAKDGAKAFVKILAGQEMGIAPFEAMGGISIIQGKATIGGNIMAAKVKGSGKYDYKIKEKTSKGCTIEFFERNPKGVLESLGTETFDEADATSAGLINKDMWKKYTKNMYFNRAISNGVRSYCPDVLGAGPVYTPEEMGATVDEDGNAIIDASTTYKQDTPVEVAPALPETISEEDIPVPRDGNPLQLISDYLLEHGVTEKEDRGRITLQIAGVEGFSNLNKNEWFEVYDGVIAMTDAELANVLPKPEPEPTTIDTVVPVTDDHLAATEDGSLLDDVTEVFGEVEKVATTKKTIKKPTSSQLATLNQLYTTKKLIKPVDQEKFNMRVIAKNHPVSAEEYDVLITALERK